LPENASTNEVEKAYKSLAIYYHPDKHVERKEWAEEKMKQLNEAKELLSNPAKRTAYIQQIKAYQNSQINQTRTLQRENIVLKRKLESSNQTNAVLGFALLLIGGAMLLGD
jgi:DnaJ-class molecular chaperone